MNDPKHTPLYVIFATKVRASSMQCVWINGPAQCLWGRFLMTVPANDEPTKEKIDEPA